MRKTAYILLAALSGCVASPSQQQQSGFPPVPPDPAPSTASAYRTYILPASDADVVKRFVAESLKDPGSATFGKITASISDRGVVSVCGMVNARNSYGGYAGQTPFMGVLATNTSGQRVFGVSGMGSTDIQSKSVLMVCQSEGIIL